MIQQHFTLLTFVICLLTVNVFAQKNTSIQPQAKSVEQAQSTVIMHTQKKEVKPLYQQVIKNETETKAEKTTLKAAPKPVFSSVARPTVYTNLDANIQKWEQKVAAIKADPNHNETRLIKHEATLERLRKIKAEKPEGY